MFSARLQFDDRKKEYLDCYEPLRLLVNSKLPNDVKIFSILPVAGKFDAKITVSHREYSYFLPTFVLIPINELNLEGPPKQN